jgi:DNA-binding NarL/FixJ family response regulator
MKMPIKLMLFNTSNMPCVAARMLIEKYSNFQIVGESHTLRGAISIAKKKMPDIALLDISSYKANIVQIPKKLSAVAPNIKILVLAMNRDKYFISKMFHAGASWYLCKDHAFDRLVVDIHNVVSQQLDPNVALKNMEPSRFCNVEVHKGFKAINES